jgi:mannose-1-phosphate guanylyltransferase
MSMHAIIMAGGSGTRFWPASRRERPKQLLPLARGKSLLEATIARVAPLVGAERTWVVTNAAQAERAVGHLAGLPPQQILVEPEPRDTAPCVALATACIEARDPGATTAFMPADHLIEPAAELGRLLSRASGIAADGATLVTFGVTPTRPATGYGYIERGQPLDDLAPRAYAAVRFREKPDPATAAELVRSGRFLWNSGIFVWQTSALLSAMDAGSPALAACTREMAAAARRGDRAALEDAFRRAPKQSIDFAVMERAPRVAVVEAQLRWNDLGSFLSLGAVAPPDGRGNVRVLHHGARAMALDAANCVVYAEGPRAVALFGVADLVVVAVEDAVLVCPRDRADELKELVGQLAANGLADLQ